MHAVTIIYMYNTIAIGVYMAVDIALAGWVSSWPQKSTINIRLVDTARIRVERILTESNSGM